MFVVLVDEVYLNGFHPFLDALQHQMVPIRRQPQEFPEVRHIVFENRHDNPGVEHAVVTAEFDVANRLLDKNGLLADVLLDLLHIENRIRWLRLQILFLFGSVTALFLLYFHVIFLSGVLSARWRLSTLISIYYFDLVQELAILLIFSLTNFIILIHLICAPLWWNFGHVLRLYVLVWHLLLRLRRNGHAFVFEDTLAVYLLDSTGQIRIRKRKAPEVHVAQESVVVGPHHTRLLVVFYVVKHPLGHVRVQLALVFQLFPHLGVTLLALIAI